MRILEVEYLGPPAMGGVELLVEALHRKFTGTGHEVEIWCSDLAGFDGSRLPPGYAEVSRMRVRRFPTRRVRPWIFDPHHLVWCGLRRALVEAAGQGSLLHLHSFPSDQVLKSLGAMAAGGRVVITPHHDTESLRRYLRLWRAQVVCRRLVRMARRHPRVSLTVHTPAARDLWVNEIGWPEAQVRVIPNGVDLEEFDRVTQAEIDATTHHWSACDVRALFVGRLARSKGVDTLLQALARVPGVGLLLIGPDAGAREELERLRQELNLEERAVFATLPRRELCAAFRACDLFVLPSRFGENFGIVAVEAMAAQKPILVSDRGGLPSLAESGRNGLVFTAESVESLADALARLAASAELRRQLGEAGRAAVEAHYTWDHVARAYLDLFAAIS
ncbi:MAG TPA: glycosyltransferase [Armatimonadetes bacterium]|nr:glycosyltransferase [Armatimonadota bacterium]